MAFGGLKMDTGSTWRAAVMLTWLLATETVHSYPRPTEPVSATQATTSTAFKTQYPPTTAGERLLISEPQGSYPTALERDGRPSQLPFPTFDISNLGSPDNGLTDLLDSLTDLLVPESSPEEAAQPASVAPEPTSTSSTHPSTSSIKITSFSSFSTAVTTSTNIKGSVSTTSSQVVQSTSSSVTVSAGSEGHLPETSSSTEEGSSNMSNQNAFIPVSAGAIPASVKSRNDHPMPRLGITDKDIPISTNKFYAGFFLGTQTNGTFTHPYSVAWAKGNGNATSYGMAVSHVESDMLAMGPSDSRLPGSPSSYYVNPIGIQSLILSASEMGGSTVLTTEKPLPFSAHIVLRPEGGSSSQITFPVVQGMGYVTGIYSKLQPVIQSSVMFRKVVSAGSPRPGVFKYQVTLEDDKSWLVYVIPDSGTDPDLKLVSNTALQGPSGFSGTIQVTKNPGGAAGEKFYDNSSGVYATEGAVDGSVSGTTGTYSLKWAKSGKDVDSTPLLMFALPHHVQSFDNTTKGRLVNLQMRTTTKGNATAVIGESWTMTEPDLPVGMGFAPWSPKKGSVKSISSAAQKVIVGVAPSELKQDIDAQTNLDSMYYSGKALSKFATLVYTVTKLANDPSLAAPALETLKKSFARFIDNQQKWPLAYDAVWKGVVSTASYGGDAGADFGNTHYNDHHFHYGYFIHAAAIIGALDPSWLSTSKDWINMLVRDAGNAATDDPLFPFSRSFDWFNGHSWAKGLFESFDGKDQESTSEDVMFAYALKMWGKTIGDASMEARGNLMLGVLKRTLQNYFLLESTNVNHPAKFIGNKVTGILFENKVDHVTYFGNNLEYIQGIHMLPLLPASGYTRTQNFVSEEWNAIFASNASTPAEKVVGGWKGVLYANLALIDPAASFNFFAQANFDYSWIDGGASRTWYLAYAAALGGA